MKNDFSQNVKMEFISNNSREAIALQSRGGSAPIVNSTTYLTLGF